MKTDQQQALKFLVENIILWEDNTSEQDIEKLIKLQETIKNSFKYDSYYLSE